MSAAGLLIKVLCLTAVTFTGRNGRQEASAGDVVEMPPDEAESLQRFGAVEPAPPQAAPEPTAPVDDAEALAAAEAARIAAGAEAAIGERMLAVTDPIVEKKKK